MSGDGKTGTEVAHAVVQPEGWPRPKGYANGVLTGPGRLLFIAGQIGWGTDERLVSSEFVPQFAKALDNVVAVLRAAGGEPRHLVRLTVYVTDKHVYRAAARELGAIYRERLGKTYVAMSLVQVADLLEDGAQVEIEATAVLPLEPAAE